jgi:hypothetical protein
MRIIIKFKKNVLEETWAFHVVAAEQIRQEFGRKRVV